MTLWEPFAGHHGQELVSAAYAALVEIDQQLRMFFRLSRAFAIASKFANLLEH